MISSAAVYSLIRVPPLVDPRGAKDLIPSEFSLPPEGDVIVGREVSKTKPTLQLIHGPPYFLSREHAVISISSDGEILITDLSMNGTYLNNRRLIKKVPYVLRDQDTVTFGGEHDVAFQSYDEQLNSLFKFQLRSCKRRRLLLDLGSVSKGSEECLCGRSDGSEGEGDSSDKVKYSKCAEGSDIDPLAIGSARKESGCIGDGSNQNALPLANEGLDGRKREEEGEGTANIVGEGGGGRPRVLKEGMQTAKRVDVDSDAADRGREKERRKVSISAEAQRAAQLEEEKEKAMEELQRLRSENQKYKSTLSAVWQQLECAVCMEIFNDPVTLNCTHVFCSKCWLACKGRAGPLLCPVCQTPVPPSTQPSLLARQIRDSLSSTGPPISTRVLVERGKGKGNGEGNTTRITVSKSVDVVDLCSQ